jgi:CarboxypepD_reg-like domain
LTFTALQTPLFLANITMRIVLIFLAMASLAATAPAANGQALLASNAAHSATTYAPTTDPTVVLSGHIANPDGPLPGAVVTLIDTKQMAVTNSEGEFQFVVPASTRTLKAVVSFAGYADEHLTLSTDDAESTATLADEQAIPMARRQQLKFYLKTARKEAHHDLREVRRNMR